MISGRLTAGLYLCRVALTRGAGERAVLRGSELFGPRARVDAELLEYAGRHGALERIAQGLAPLGEGRAHHPIEARRGAEVESRCRERRDAHDRRSNLGRRREGACADIQQALDPHPGREHDGEPSVNLRAGRRHHAVDDFLLQHEMHVADRGALLEQAKEQRRRNVVGKIAHQAQRRPGAAQGGDIDLQDVLVDQRERRTESLAEIPGQVAIDLDRRERAELLEQRCRERSAAGPDLDDALAAPRLDRRDDARDHLGIVEEVLAEALAHVARVIACSIAALRLPDSAWPLPASESAVPWSTEVRMIGRPSVTLTAEPKPASLSAGKPWSWYIASTTSASASERGVKAVSAGMGPDTSAPRSRARSMAGVMTSISSRP